MTDHDKPSWERWSSIRSIRDLGRTVLEAIMEPFERAYDKAMNGDEED